MSSWEPNASRKLLETRAALLNKVRSFFLERGVLEVETPLLASSSITDPNIEIFETEAEQKKYLQTSPEYAMKRLLCAGSGPIFQIAKAFRSQEIGRYHNPEFSILEWYRPDYDYHKLIQIYKDDETILDIRFEQINKEAILRTIRELLYRN